jgi:hypothetical protein
MTLSSSPSVLRRAVGFISIFNATIPSCVPANRVHRPFFIEHQEKERLAAVIGYLERVTLGDHQDEGERAGFLTLLRGSCAPGSFRNTPNIGSRSVRPLSMK